MLSKSFVKLHILVIWTAFSLHSSNKLNYLIKSRLQSMLKIALAERTEHCQGLSGLSENKGKITMIGN